MLLKVGEKKDTKQITKQTNKINNTPQSENKKM